MRPSPLTRKNLKHRQDKKNTRIFELLPHQERFVYSSRRYICNSGGVGSGKTYSIALRTLRLMIEHPGIFVLLGAQTFPLLRDTLMREFLFLVPSGIIYSYNKSEHHIQLHNGSEVIFRSFDDPSKLKSLNLGACGIEEMTDVKEDIFKMLRTRMRQDHMPGCIYGATNPDSYQNWVYQYFIEDPIALSEVIYSVSIDNKYLPTQYLEDLEDLRRTNPEYYARMVAGQWGSLEGRIYNLPQTAIFGTKAVCPNKRYLPYSRYIAGLDFGYTHPTAFIVIGIDEYRYDVLFEFCEKGLSSSDIVLMVKKYMSATPIEIIYCDSSRPEIINDLVAEGIPAVAAIKDVFDGIMFIKGLIGNDRLKIHHTCHQLIKEMGSYAWDKKNPLKEVPIKMFDDLNDSVRYAIFSDHRKYGHYSDSYIDDFDGRSFFLDND